ncbi:hypothetical protein J27TS7_22480 [Paenibacillus dendritiformis]|uniref:response regulator transcription factor n=1 Tax=Paenibacillus dendritiformis TaxID=130049 RepID=UPI001B0BAC18|nr:response regulator transcription factor [Paenibacillus dendritiformis]GIO72734.1 hypothetical protein J27TS7_22480 [Paenibacillus dendritiformis]
MSWRPDLVLLDLTLPDQDGMEILKQLRQYGSCPVIIVTARGAVPDRLRGLQEGADDYIPKPFDPEEVVARVQAVLRRSAYMADHETVRLGSLVIDFTACAAYLNEQAVPLIPRDWSVLAFLSVIPINASAASSCWTTYGELTGSIPRRCLPSTGSRSRS